jgi:hypothetical protein
MLELMKQMINSIIRQINSLKKKKSPPNGTLPLCYSSGPASVSLLKDDDIQVKLSPTIRVK